MKKSALMFAVFLLLTVSVSIAEERTRACKLDDILGTWQMRSISTKLTIDPRDPFASPYQWFAFDGSGRFKQMTSNDPIAGNERVIKQFAERIPTTRYELDPKGMLTLARIETPNPEVCFCTYVLEGVPAEKLAALPEAKRWNVPQKGDLVLTYKNAEGKPILAKSLRRVKS